ncbi:MAG: ABC transporter permease [Lautropia sp.]
MPAQRWLDALLVALAVLALWQAASWGFGAYWVTSPLATARQLLAMLASGELPRHAGYTLLAALAGFAIGAVPGVLLPLALRRWPLAIRILDPFLVAGYGLPKLALAPLFILWFGIGLASKIALAASVVFFIVFFSTMAGVQSVDPRLIRMARVIGASEAQLARRVVWPAVLPHLFAGIRIATPYAIGGVIISELVSANRGLGYLIQYGAMSFSTPEIFATVLAITVLIAVSSGLAALLERRLLRWRASPEGEGGDGRLDVGIGGSAAGAAGAGPVSGAGAGAGAGAAGGYR